MNITLYLACNDEHLKCFADYFSDNDVIYKVSRCYMGYCVELECDGEFLDSLSTQIAGFIIEFYLKESVLLKIYEEYAELDVNDAVKLFSEITKNVCSLDAFNMILDILQKAGQINIDSFIIFNIRQIMQNLYEKVDILAENMLTLKTREAFVNMLKTYSVLNNRGCTDAFVEFSDENMCKVVLDDSDEENVDVENLLALLTEHSPQNIILKNSDNCVPVSDILRDVFNGRITELNN